MKRQCTLLLFMETVFNNVRKVGSLGIIVLAVQFMSCEYHVENEELVDDSCTPAISYSAIIRPLIDNNCMPCHNGDGSIPQAPDLTNYTSVANVSGLIKEVTQSRRMPLEGSITDEQIEAIRCWVDNGALNN